MKVIHGVGGIELDLAVTNEIREIADVVADIVGEQVAASEAAGIIMTDAFRVKYAARLAVGLMLDKKEGEE